jgi:hypothetical protein
VRPDPARVLEGVTFNLAAGLGPEVASAFGKSTVEHAAGLLMVLAEEVDRLADRLSRENAAVAALLGDASPLVSHALQERVRDALANGEPPDIRVSTLRDLNDSFRGLLIDVHAEVEALHTPEASAMDERIWDELRESTRRRHLQVFR